MRRLVDVDVEDVCAAFHLAGGRWPAHASQSPAFRAFENLGEPVMLVRSPMTRKFEAEMLIAEGFGHEKVEAVQATVEGLETAQAQDAWAALRQHDADATAAFHGVGDRGDMGRASNRSNRRR